MNTTNVVITSISPSALQSVHDYFAGWFASAFWGGVGVVVGISAAVTFLWMVGKAHE